MNYLLTNQDNNYTDIEYENFIIRFKRLEVMQNYHDAFLLVLSMHRTSKTNNRKEICDRGIKILETNIRGIETQFTKVKNKINLLLLVLFLVYHGIVIT